MKIETMKPLPPMSAHPCCKRINSCIVLDKADGELTNQH